MVVVVVVGSNKSTHEDVYIYISYQVNNRPYLASIL